MQAGEGGEPPVQPRREVEIVVPGSGSEKRVLTESIMVRVDSTTLTALDALRGENGRGAQVRLILQAALDTEPAKPKKLRRISAGESPRPCGQLDALMSELGSTTGAFVMTAKALRLSRQRLDLHAEVERMIVEFRQLHRQIEGMISKDDRP